MNTISSGMIGQMMAMDGRTYFNAATAYKRKQSVEVPQTGTMPAGFAEVAQNIAQNLAQTKENVQQLQKLSDMVMGHKLQFNVNDELGKVVVKVVDSRTDEVIREIPSQDVQKLHARMRQTMSLLFDEMV
ncbi:MAG: flagellar protein FlaG [Treponema sp.]|nr:flagellar protein FlaG [Treponema sp.]